MVWLKSKMPEVSGWCLALVRGVAKRSLIFALVPAEKLPVAESGLRSADDLRRMAEAGARCVLVGEHLLRETDIEAATLAFLGR